jgi:AraC-like DNA-binding protein
MDALESALTTFHFQSLVYCSLSTNHAPWGVAIDPWPWPCFQFHAIRSGRCWIAIEDRMPVELDPGDFAMIPHGSRHKITHEPGAACISGAELVAASSRTNPWIIDIPGSGRQSQLICAGFVCAPGTQAAVLRALPDFVHLRANETASLEPILALAQSELTAPQQATDVVLVRLAELLLVEAVRSYARTLRPSDGGWFAALQDERISIVLGLIHGDPAENWRLHALATKAGMSRSLLTARFRALVGLSVHGYITRLRMDSAAALLRQTGHVNLASIAHKVGYSSEPVFIRAFERTMGMTPTTFRSRIHNQPEPV